MKSLSRLQTYCNEGPRETNHRYDGDEVHFPAVVICRHGDAEVCPRVCLLPVLAYVPCMITI